jgi:catalase-peroxidase
MCRKKILIWQDPVPAVDHALIDDPTSQALKAKMLGCGLSVSDLVFAAWASASTFRGSDKRGGANGARIRLAPQKDWEVNQPAKLSASIKLEAIQSDFNDKASRRQEGLAGRPDRARRLCRVEKAAKRRWHDITVPFTPGRTDATEEQTDAESFEVWSRSPTASATTSRAITPGLPRRLLVDKAQLLTLTAPEMTVLVGGMRVLGQSPGRGPWRLHRSARSVDERLLRQRFDLS